MSSWAKKTLLVIVGAFCLQLIYRVSVGVGEKAERECLFAIFLFGLSSLVGMIFTSKLERKSFERFIASFFISTALRVLITIAGVATIIRFVDLRAKSFIGWTVFFYFILIAVETVRRVKTIRNFDWDRQDFFKEEDDDFVISQNKSHRGSSK